MNETVKLFLLFSMVAIIVLIIANIELAINKNKSIYSGELMKTFEMIPVRKTGLKDPIWIYNTKNTHARDIRFTTNHNYNKYIKSTIDEHLASKMNKPLFSVLTYNLDGYDSSGYTYSMPGWYLYVMEPNMNSVNEAKNRINEYLKG